MGPFFPAFPFFYPLTTSHTENPSPHVVPSLLTSSGKFWCYNIQLQHQLQIGPLKKMLAKDQHELKTLIIWLKYQHISKYHWPVAHVQHEKIPRWIWLSSKLELGVGAPTRCSLRNLWMNLWHVQSRSFQPNSHAKLWTKTYTTQTCVFPKMFSFSMPRYFAAHLQLHEL